MKKYLLSIALLGSVCMAQDLPNDNNFRRPIVLIPSYMHVRYFTQAELSNMRDTQQPSCSLFSPPPSFLSSYEWDGGVSSAAPRIFPRRDFPFSQANSKSASSKS